MGESDIEEGTSIMRATLEWEVKLLVTLHPTISERLIESVLNEGWEPIGMVVYHDRHYAYYRRLKPKLNKGANA